MTTAHYPATRLRRNRNAKWSRNLVAENHLSTNDLILPLFIHEEKDNISCKALPDTQVHSIDSCLKQIKKAEQLGINAVALFPRISNYYKTDDGNYCFNPDNILIKTIQQIKEQDINVGIIADVALDPYTTHGHDGVIDSNGHVLNDQTIEILTKQSLALAKAGCDIIAPSDMMDGRIGAIRKELESDHYHDTQILSYAAKYSSNFYGPFRSALGSDNNLGKANKSSYQMDFCNSKEALTEASLDITEGSDILMVKPAMLYLDIIKQLYDQYNLPIFAYQVSGEYTMLKSAITNNIFADMFAVFYESLVACKRAGASAIFTYAALEIAEELNG